MHVNCGTEQVPIASEPEYELQLTLCRHSVTSNGYDERLCCASACNCETEHVVMGSKGCRSFPLAYSGATDRNYEH